MTSRDDTGHIRARVMDFGLALATSEDRLTKTGTLVGTVVYFSPEQVTSRSFDGRSDVYALGTVLYECLAGEPPFTGEVQSVLYRVVHELPQPMRNLGADVSEELEAAVLQCLAKDPEKRPKRAGHLAEALRRYRSKLREEDFGKSVVFTASRMLPRPAVAAPFIGREKEMAELQRRLHAALAGECEFVVLAGEPGHRQEPPRGGAQGSRAGAQGARPVGALRRARPRLRPPGLLRAHPGLLPLEGHGPLGGLAPGLHGPRGRPPRALPRPVGDRRAARPRRAATRARSRPATGARPRTRSRSSSSSRAP